MGCSCQLGYGNAIQKRSFEPQPSQHQVIPPAWVETCPSRFTASSLDPNPSQAKRKAQKNSGSHPTPPSNLQHWSAAMSSAMERTSSAPPAEKTVPAPASSSSRPPAPHGVEWDPLPMVQRQVLHKPSTGCLRRVGAVVYEGWGWLTAGFMWRISM